MATKKAAKKDTKPKKDTHHRGCLPKVDVDAMTPEQRTILFDSVFIEIATSNIGIAKILKANPDFPSMTKFYEYLFSDEDLQKRYARAKQIQAERLIQEIIEIADDTSGDIKETEWGFEVNSEFVQRSKLKIETRKWLAMKLLPKIYGDKLDMTSNGETIKAIVGMQIK